MKIKMYFALVAAGASVTLPLVFGVANGGAAAVSTITASGRCSWVTGAAPAGTTIRAQHNKNSKALISVPTGAQFKYEKCPQQGWVQAEYKGQRGWAYNGNLQRSGAVSGGNASSSGSTKQCYTLVGGTKIRSGPGEEYRVLKTLPGDAPITIGESNGGWTKVTSPINGWAKTGFNCW